MYRFTSDGVNLEQLRTRLQKMSDTDLLRFGKTGKYMCSSEADVGKSPRKAFVIKLEEARAEWNRRKTQNDIPARETEIDVGEIDAAQSADKIR